MERGGGEHRSAQCFTVTTPLVDPDSIGRLLLPSHHRLSVSPDDEQWLRLPTVHQHWNAGPTAGCVQACKHTRIPSAAMDGVPGKPKLRHKGLAKKSQVPLQFISLEIVGGKGECCVTLY
ncbi:hypothetical protein MUK42_04049 [Musa troglodytarum]|uniref:Uncharacterized protein n=1 Tax=Musa troglodytarum TaxID=320322 RepID=A0A9E7GCE1_9LILI|nr:hypothetical protein MUK42_04049 [Musa troglodytarum]